VNLARGESKRITSGFRRPQKSFGSGRFQKKTQSREASKGSSCQGGREGEASRLEFDPGSPGVSVRQH
jgi:hypothetical protein